MSVDIKDQSLIFDTQTYYFKIKYTNGGPVSMLKQYSSKKLLRLKHRSHKTILVKNMMKFKTNPFVIETEYKSYVFHTDTI